jgi:Flp pilus assembly protein TadG
MRMGRFCRNRLRRPWRATRLWLARVAVDDSGAAAIEFGVLVPVLALIGTAVVDIGLGISRKIQVEDAAQAGIQYVIMHGYDTNGISSAVTSATGNSQITASPPPVQYCGCPTSTAIGTVSCGTICPNSAPAGTYVTVAAQSTYRTTLNYVVAPADYSFSAQSTVRMK